MYRLTKQLTGVVICLLVATSCNAQDTKQNRSASTTAADNTSKVSPVFGIAIPAGYRSWELIAPSYRTDLKWIRAILGNPISMSAYRVGTLPFPDGTVLAKLAWKSTESAELKDAIVPGQATILEYMVKDSKKYASTGGWGFARFIDGKPDNKEQHEACFGCHQALVKGNDFVFTRYAP